jgi:hypothetical protein
MFDYLLGLGGGASLLARSTPETSERSHDIVENKGTGFKPQGRPSWPPVGVRRLGATLLFGGAAGKTYIRGRVAARGEAAAVQTAARQCTNLRNEAGMLLKTQEREEGGWRGTAQLLPWWRGPGGAG